MRELDARRSGTAAADELLRLLRDEREAQLVRRRRRRLALARHAQARAIALGDERDLDRVVEQVEVAHPLAQRFADRRRGAADVLDDAERTGGVASAIASAICGFR